MTTGPARHRDGGPQLAPARNYSQPSIMVACPVLSAAAGAAGKLLTNATVRGCGRCFVFSFFFPPPMRRSRAPVPATHCVGHSPANSQKKRTESTRQARRKKREKNGRCRARRRLALQSEKEEALVEASGIFSLSKLQQQRYIDGLADKCSVSMRVRVRVCVCVSDCACACLTCECECVCASCE